jgi:hypothetical protein
MTPIAYVAGYGRSGSTLLDVVLGAGDAVVSLGEVGMLWRLLDDPAAHCSCGEAIAKCPYWGPVVAAFADAGAPSAADCDRLSRSHEHWVRGWFKGERKAVEGYGKCWRAVLGAAAAACGARLVVDSSKTAYRHFWRPRALCGYAGADVRLLHLIRDPRAVVASCMKGQNSRLAKGDDRTRPFAWAIALIGWAVANVGARLNARRLGREKLLVVQYENLLSEPEHELARIGRFLGVDFSAVAERMRRGEALPVGHLIGGNRMLKKGVVFARTQPEEVARAPGIFAELACRWFAVPLHRRMIVAAKARPR